MNTLNNLNNRVRVLFHSYSILPQKPAQVNLEDIITRYGNHFPNQQPPLWRIHNHQMHLIVRYVRLRNIPCMLVRSSSCSLTTRCCPLSAQAMYVLIVSNQAKNCGSNNRCRKCQKPHHTLLHRESAENKEQSEPPSTESSALAVAPMVSSYAQSGYAQSGSGTTLLMTCQMFVNAPDGTCVRARSLLDSGSSTSFISE